MITSQFGAILVYILPRPVHSYYSDPHAGDRNVEVMMDRVQASTINGEIMSFLDQIHGLSSQFLKEL